MSKTEATKLANSYNKHETMSAQVVRILPESVDPIRPNDNGWDVKVTYFPDFNQYED